MNKYFIRLKASFATFLFLAFLCLIFSLPTAIYADSHSDSLEYLASFQNIDSGGLGEEYVVEAQGLQTDWAIMAFASAGFDASTVGVKKSLVNFALNDACSLTSITDIERRIIALESSGIDTSKLAFCNLPSRLQQDTSGKIGPNLVSTVFGVLALKSSGNDISSDTIDYITSNQNSDGGWDSGYGTESNFTAQVIMALKSSDINIDTSIYDRAKTYLKSLQTDTGGIKYDHGQWSTESDAFSDSFVLQAINSLGEDPWDLYWFRNGYSILDDLDNLRNSDGSYSYSRTYGKMTPVWTTAIAIIGLNNSFLPIDTQLLSGWHNDDVLSPVPSATVRQSTTPTATAIVAVEVSATAQVASPYVSGATAVASPLSVVGSGTVRSGAAVQQEVESLVQKGGEPFHVSATDSPSAGKVLSATADQKSVFWLWAATTGIIAFITGILTKFIETRYVYKKK